MSYNPFDHYPLAEERQERAPNWFMGLERALFRSDGLRIVRSHNRPGWHLRDHYNADRDEFISARQVGSGEDIDAAHWVDSRYPITPPDVACGQVWAGDEGTEMQILSVARDLTGLGCPVAVVATPDGLQPLIWSHPPTGAVLVAGLGAPWVPAGWRKPAEPEESVQP